MVVVFEFLSSEPIENVITCMHCKVDKVVYFGYHDTIQMLKDSTTRFLSKYCGINQVIYHSVPKTDLSAVHKTMRKEIECELGRDNSIYVDITGGESLMLVAFGMLAKEFDLPMHHFDISQNKILELHKGADNSISRELRAENIGFSLDSYVELRGGIINTILHKNTKNLNDSKRLADVMNMFSVAKKQWLIWNAFSVFLRNNTPIGDVLEVNMSVEDVRRAISKSNSKIFTLSKLNGIINDLEKTGVVHNVVNSTGQLAFRYKNLFVKECIWDAGSVLELQVYQDERKDASECRVGVHIDWDGVIRYPGGIDVLNEVDVLAIKGNIPIFISCKSGRIEGPKVLPALYELETVAKRFGGKYAKKVLVITSEIGEAYMDRAKEMGIEIRIK